MQSVSKTVTSVVIGVATARHEFPPLDTPVLSFFDAGQVKNVDARKQRMTLRHLLTMTAGLEWHEDLPYDDPKNSCGLMEASFDWVRFAIDQPMSDEPGARFNYNSGATQLLAHVFRKATGHDLEEYAARHLFARLGIERWFWKRTPTGLADSEGGLYLRPRDLAKIAYLFLKDGRWEGQAIVDRDWVKDSLAPSTTVADGVRYGFKWWLVRLQAAVRVRFPLVPGVNDEAAHVRRLAEVVASLGFREIDVVPYRRPVSGAYEALGRPNPSASLQEPPADAIAEVLQRLSACGLTARVVPRRV